MGFTLPPSPPLRLVIRMLDHGSQSLKELALGMEWPDTDIKKIKCAYCGGKWDSEKHSTCPSCGAPEE